ncbi:hypothetical protein CYMTET_13822 [Cymbomonas tetramitiformis]|uniref:Uncharacterized protein n=1 Tax=Cymbomonas tetramitiformis TaxID=36881 RepID=A0AAE0GHV9_9CHLO|nr:hypothetical protein CYMTET_13822 [Cymbomonas tetramitiformis]
MTSGTLEASRSSVRSENCSEFLRGGCNLLRFLNPPELTKLLFQGRGQQKGGLLRVLVRSCEGLDELCESENVLSARTDVGKLYELATGYLLNRLDARTGGRVYEYIEGADVESSFERLLVCLSIVKQIAMRLIEFSKSSEHADNNHLFLEKEAFFRLDMHEALLPEVQYLVDKIAAAFLHSEDHDELSCNWNVYMQTQDELHSMCVKIKDFLELHSEVIQRV